MTAPKLNGNTRLAIASLAEADLKDARREKAECVTRLVKLDQRIALNESILAVAGVDLNPEPESDL